MSETGKGMVYSLPIDVLEEILCDCEKEFRFSETLLIEKLAVEESSQKNRSEKIISLLCDFYSASYVTIEQVKELLEEGEGEEDDEQVYLSPESMSILETALLSRYFVSKELTKFNISLAIN